ncbi:MAG: hypothetical protein IPM82_08815 [Saprospiraceae bacterium]|nr:hypothetical protein [Saprospiraceae bacterium]
MKKLKMPPGVLGENQISNAKPFLASHKNFQAIEKFLQLANSPQNYPSFGFEN